MLNAKKAAVLRHEQLDSKRKKLIEDLDRREKEANAATARRHKYSTESKTPEENLKDEIDRLRKEGSKLLAEEQELMQKQLAEERKKLNPNTLNSVWDSSQYRIKIKWKADKGDESNGGYTESILRKFLQKYGEINVLVLSPKKRGSALVEFKTQDASEMAIAYEKGHLKNPLTFEWIGEAPKHRKRHPTGSSTVTEIDFESLVLRQMRQAEERKRLVEQMIKEDADG